MSFQPFEPVADLSPIRTAEAVRSGPPVTPIQRIYLYDDAEWEEFTREWAASKKTQYLKVEKYAGAGDKGIDVAGFADPAELLGVWDCFQCKHYGNSLNRSDWLCCAIRIEAGLVPFPDIFSACGPSRASRVM